MQMKLTQKIDHFTVFNSFSAHRSSCQITYKKLAGWTCKVVSGMFSLDGGREMNWWEKVTLQNCGRALVKLKNYPGGAMLAP